MFLGVGCATIGTPNLLASRFITFYSRIVAEINLDRLMANWPWESNHRLFSLGVYVYVCVCMGGRIRARVVAQYGSSWHTSTATIVSSSYSAFSSNKVTADIGGYIGLMHINITYRRKSFLLQINPIRSRSIVRKEKKKKNYVRDLFRRIGSFSKRRQAPVAKPKSVDLNFFFFFTVLNLPQWRPRATR